MKFSSKIVSIEAYDIKAKRKVMMKNPKKCLMKNGSWALKGTSSETGITLYKIVGKKEPQLRNSKVQAIIDYFKR